MIRTFCDHRSHFLRRSVVVLLVVVGALIVYLVPWRRRPAFASPSLSVELNPTTYNELGRSVEGI